jgi:hypothetical protein
MRQSLSKTRIDFAGMVAQPIIMGDVAILFKRARKPIAASEWLLDRAARAREISTMLSRADARLVEGYAAECEAEADRVIEQLRIAIAA